MKDSHKGVENIERAPKLEFMCINGLARTVYLKYEGIITLV